MVPFNRVTETGIADSAIPDASITTVTSSAVPEAALRRVCYYTNWAQYRSSRSFRPENIDASLCTHLIYSFATMEGNLLKTFEYNDEAMYARFNAHRVTNPSLKTLLAVGGYNFGVVKMSAMLKTSVSRTEFANGALSFLRRHGFDGLDLDFEYPAARGSPAEDKQRFSLLVKVS